MNRPLNRIRRLGDVGYYFGKPEVGLFSFRFSCLSLPFAQKNISLEFVYFATNDKSNNFFSVEWTTASESNRASYSIAT